MKIPGKIVAYSSKEEILYIKAPFNRPEILSYQGITEAEIVLTDGRIITPRQRNKIFAMVKDISNFCNGTKVRTQETAEYTQALWELGLLYVLDKTDSEEIRFAITNRWADLLNIELFSLSNIDKTTARYFIDWLVEMCIKHRIATNDLLANRAEDVVLYVYNCLIHKQCCVKSNGCSGAVHLHHVDKVGMGRNRHHINHIGMRGLPLCESHHIYGIHIIGDEKFMNQYHIQPATIDETICKIHKLSYVI